MSKNLHEDQKNLNFYCECIYLQHMMESITSGLFVLNTNLEFTIWNSQLEKTYDIPAEEVLGKNILDIFPTVKNENVYDCILKVLETGKSFTIDKENHLSKKKGLRVIKYKIDPLLGLENEILGIIVVVDDVTERVDFEVEYLSKMQHFMNILQNSADGIIFFDENENVTLWNKGAEQIFGYTSEEMIGRDCNNLLPKHLQEQNELKYISEQVETKGFLSRYETERLTKDSRKIIVSITKSPCYDSNGKYIGSSSIVRDITESKKIQEKLQKSEKLASIGQLMAGIGHEIGTPLNVISGCAEYLLYVMDEEDEKRHELKTIVSETDRITKLIQQILDYTRKKKPKFNNVDINNILRNVLGMLERQLAKSNIKVSAEYNRGLPKLLCDEGQIQQVFLNILNNAIDAISEGGEIDIDIELRNDNKIDVIIKDTGRGISKQDLERIFEPFFSTKKEHGTGLGLSITYGIVQKLGGQIRAASKLGEGTTFTVTLPIEASFAEE